MSGSVRRLTLGAVLFVSVCLLATSGPAWADEDDEKIQGAQKDIILLAKAIKEGKVNPAAADVIKKKYDLEHVMYVFKPKDKKGPGWDPASKEPGNGIEFKYINLGKRALSKMQLTNQKANLIRMAYLTAAVGDVAGHYPPPKGGAGKGPADWKKYNQDMKKTALEFIKAIESGDPKKVKEAANNVNATCNGCHSDFRDS
jgi:hypothetical protein